MSVTLKCLVPWFRLGAMNGASIEFQQTAMMLKALGRNPALQLLDIPGRGNCGPLTGARLLHGYDHTSTAAERRNAGTAVRNAVVNSMHNWGERNSLAAARIIATINSAAAVVDDDLFDSWKAYVVHLGTEGVYVDDRWWTFFCDVYNCRVQMVQLMVHLTGGPLEAVDTTRIVRQELDHMQHQAPPRTLYVAYYPMGHFDALVLTSNATPDVVLIPASLPLWKGSRGAAKGGSRAARRGLAGVEEDSDEEDDGARLLTRKRDM